MLIHPDGSYEFYNKLDDFSGFDLDILNECSDFLTDHRRADQSNRSELFFLLVNEGKYLTLLGGAKSRKKRKDFTHKYKKIKKTY